MLPSPYLNNMAWALTTWSNVCLLFLVSFRSPSLCYGWTRNNTTLLHIWTSPTFHLGDLTCFSLFKRGVILLLFLLLKFCPFSFAFNYYYYYYYYYYFYFFLLLFLVLQYKLGTVSFRSNFCNFCLIYIIFFCFITIFVISFCFIKVV